MRGVRSRGRRSFDALWGEAHRFVELRARFALVGVLGWFFLMINESFVLGKKDFRLPGLGSSMSVAAARGDVPAMLRAMAAMTVMIVVLDQLVFRPLVSSPAG